MVQSNNQTPEAVQATSVTFIDALKQGNDLAWQRLSNLYGPLVRYWIRQNDLGDTDAADISQEVFATVHKNIERFEKRQPLGSFRKWLKVVTFCRTADHFRNRAERPEAIGGTSIGIWLSEQADPFDDSLLNEDESEVQTEQAAIVQRVLEIVKPEFSDNVWKCFWKTSVDGGNATETGKELEMKPDAVRQNKSRVMKRLREALEEHLC